MNNLICLIENHPLLTFFLSILAVMMVLGIALWRAENTKNDHKTGYSPKEGLDDFWT